MADFINQENNNEKNQISEKTNNIEDNTKENNNGKQNIEDKDETDDFLKLFSTCFQIRQPSTDEDISTISLEKYEYPKVTDFAKEKIDRLQNITNSIEKNLIQNTVCKNNKIKNKIDYEKSLNEMQYIAATTIEGPLLVIAGAGTGKTRTIVYRVAFLLENGIPPSKILLLTFTRKAANEMLAKTTSLLNDIRCQNVLGGTFHSIANYLLRKYSKFLNIPPNFTIIDTVDSEDIIDLIRHEKQFEKRSRAFPKKSRVQEIISKSRNCNKTIKEIIEHEFKGLIDFVKDIELIEKYYSEYKKAHNYFDYDDLMEFLRDSLKTNLKFRENVQNMFHYIMVDEFQDTNTIQKEIIDLIGEKYRNVMVVGDDSQSIYSFRGANFENILRFPEIYPDCKYVKIEYNYRSGQEILSFTNSVLKNAKIGYKKKLFSTKKSSYKPILKKIYNQEDEAEYIVLKILEIREREIPLNQIAVLYRASFHSRFIEAELLKRKIPYIVFGGIRFIERRHVKDIIAYLRIILNPLDPVSWNRILKLIPNIGNVKASKIVNYIHNLEGKIDFGAFTNEKYYLDLERLSNVLNQISKQDVSISNKIDILKDHYSPILKDKESDYEIRLMDIDVLYMLACKYDDLEKFLSDLALDPPSNKFQNKTYPSIDEEEDKPLILSTIHSAKGLEWNSVFIIHLLDGLFPTSMSIKDFEELEEERRLFYVACTRAKEQLYLTMPSQIAKYDGFLTFPSRFLVEVEKDKYEYLK